MDAREAYGFVCLAVGAAVVIGQIWVLLRTQAAAEKVDEASTAAKLATLQNLDSLNRARSLLESVALVHSGSGDGGIQAARDELVSASEHAADTDKAVANVADKIDDWRGTIASNLSDRVPLATAGIVLIVLGAVVNGYLDVAAGNGSAPG